MVDGPVVPSGGPSRPVHADRRHELLLTMYNQMFNDINRHIMTVWQSVATLAGTAALLALVEKHVMPLDVAVTFVVIVCGWLLANCYDSAYWYNRNLVIIANIERQFLDAADLHRIHYYFGEHRANLTMLTHLRIQQVLGLVVLVLTIAVHFTIRVVPAFDGSWRTFDPLRAMPYAVGIVTAVLVLALRHDRQKAYAAFLCNSPGVAIDTAGVRYGTGHPVDKP